MGAPRFVKPRVVGVSPRLVRSRHRIVRLRGTVGQDGDDHQPRRFAERRDLPGEHGGRRPQLRTRLRLEG